MNPAPPSITLDRVYPWGRSFDEYVRMFSLSEADLRLRIVACADGPAAFNCEMTRRGHPVVSCDPLYGFTTEEIRHRIDQTREILVDMAARDASRFKWDRIATPQQLGDIRMAAMGQFLDDYELGRTQGRYLDRSLPCLGFPDNSFDLALCSHFLFLYSDEFPLEFHVRSVLEMCRIAPDVRLFPLLDMHGRPSPHVEPLIQWLQREGLDAAIVDVDYEFQQGGNRMMHIH